MNIFIKRLLTCGFRRPKRHRVIKRLYVVFEYTSDKYPIGDISMGGLSFFYEDKGVKPGVGSYKLKIVGRNHLSLRDFPFISISDCEVGEFIFPKSKIKRHSVQFGRLTSRLENQLKSVIQAQTLSPE
ncbi:MAG: hypothetical protein GY699_07970 [Desulfobacteraceae bacterium]|nr:hypothetical protein [Desulfobacteraceae bacterium]